MKTTNYNINVDLNSNVFMFAVCALARVIKMCDENLVAAIAPCYGDIQTVQ